MHRGEFFILNNHVLQTKNCLFTTEAQSAQRELFILNNHTNYKPFIHHLGTELKEKNVFFVLKTKILFYINSIRLVRH